MYCAVNSTSNILYFLLCANRDFKAAKGLFRKTLHSNYCQSPRVISAGNNPAYSKAIKELINSNKLANTCNLRQNKYLNNLVEQNHRFIKKLANPELRFASFNTARRTLKGAQMMHIIPSQVAGLSRGDVLAQIKFITNLFGVIPKSILSLKDFITSNIFATKPLISPNLCN